MGSVGEKFRCGLGGQYLQRVGVEGHGPSFTANGTGIGLGAEQDFLMPDVEAVEEADRQADRSLVLAQPGHRADDFHARGCLEFRPPERQGVQGDHHIQEVRLSHGEELVQRDGVFDVVTAGFSPAKFG